MTSHAVALYTSPHSWEGRIVNGKYPLLECIEGASLPAIYLTEVAGASAVLKLMPANVQQSTQVAAWTLASQLSHPNLVRILDAGLWHADDEQDMHFAVMEYCDESLAGVLRQRALTVAEAREVLLPALDALKYLHGQGIVHGQISPANILARGDQLKLAVDWLQRPGVAQPRQVIGPYDAPEAAVGTIAPSSDLWALGVTLHEALTRHLPIREAGGAAETTEKLPSPFDDIVKGCLAEDRDKRLSISAIRNLLDRPGPELVIKATAEAAAPIVPPADIRMVRPPASPATSDAPPPKNAETTPRRNRRAFIIAICAVALLLAVLMLVRRSDSDRSTAPASSTQATVNSKPVARSKPSSTHPAATTNTAGAPLREVLPEVSGQARSTINGSVKLGVRVAVNTDGKVTRATLAAHGPSPYFARQALEAARQWTFTPPVRDGKPQASDWIVHFDFRRSGTKAAAQRL